MRNLDSKMECCCYESCMHDTRIRNNVFMRDNTTDIIFYQHNHCQQNNVTANFFCKV